MGQPDPSLRTIQASWDADRLDLGRVGTTPDPARLCTAAARDPEMFRWAGQRSGGALFHRWWTRPGTRVGPRGGRRVTEVT
jgi:uncharacterized protein